MKAASRIIVLPLMCYVFLHLVSYFRPCRYFNKPLMRNLHAKLYIFDKSASLLSILAWLYKMRKVSHYFRGQNFIMLSIL
jgi:hypothetical protein